jgi:hypothetical protein
MKLASKLVVGSLPIVLVAGLGLAAPANAATSTVYTATLTGLSGSHAHGTLTLTLKGNKATIVEDVTGLASKFMGKPFPHVQHIHTGGLGKCPTIKADKNNDGVISTTEGTPAYGGIGASLTTSGDASPKAGLTLTTAPSGGSIHYKRTITLDKATVKAIKEGKATIVVHGLDPAKLSKKAQKEKSDIVPSLPLAATSPAVCGKLHT